jgi:hypothetical protein
LTGYAAPRHSPAGPLAEIHRRRAEGALQAALSATTQINLLEEAIACAVRDAEELMEEEVALRAGDRYERSPGREGYRNGTAPGYVALGGRKLKLRRPRLCTQDGRDLPLVSYPAMQDPGILDRAALGKVIDGVAQRQAHESYARDQPVPADREAYGDSKSSISRRWIAATGQSLAEQMNRRLDDRRYLAILLDGKGFGEHLLVTALGIDEGGHKRVLGIRDGGSEDQRVCAALLQDLTDRGLDVGAGVLVVIDGGKGLAAAVRALWGDVAVVGRCREHKKRNVIKHLPKSEHRWVRQALWRAWHLADVEEAERELRALATELEPRWKEAAASLREGLAETMTCQRLGLPRELAAALGTTNLIESAFATTECICGRVRRWRNAAQAKRWATMALLKAERGFGVVAPEEAMAELAKSLERQLRERAVARPLAV